MVSIFYGSTFLHRSQLLCIINRALHPFARATHLLLPSLPPLLLFSLAARRRGQSYESNNPPSRVKWISIDSKHSPSSSNTRGQSVGFFPFFLFFLFFFLSFFRTTNIEIAVSSFVQLNSRYCKCTKHNNVEAVGNSFCVRDNALKYYKLCKGTLVTVVYASIGTSSSNSSKVSR